MKLQDVVSVGQPNRDSSSQFTVKNQFPYLFSAFGKGMQNLPYLLCIVSITNLQVEL
jgi:hypothetical protein